MRRLFCVLLFESYYLNEINTFSALSKERVWPKQNMLTPK